MPAVITPNSCWTAVTTAMSCPSNSTCRNSGYPIGRIGFGFRPTEFPRYVNESPKKKNPGW